MILIRFVLFLALTLGAVWYFLANPDRQAEITTIERDLQFEAEQRDTTLTAVLEKNRLVSSMIARSPQIAALVDPKIEVPGNEAFVTVVGNDGKMSEEDALEGLRTLETSTGLNNIRILRRDSAVTVPEHSVPQELADDGTWDAGIETAFNGLPAHAIYSDASGNPVFVLFAPYSAEGGVSAVVISEAGLGEEQSRWVASAHQIVVSDESGKVILTNTAEVGPEVIVVERTNSVLGAKITVSASKPEMFGPWIIRSAAVTLIAILGFFLWEQQRARRAVIAELSEVRRVKAVELEEEITSRKSELGEVKNRLAVSESLAMLGQVSASIGQEINQPLSGIKAYSETALQFIVKGDPDLATQNIQKISKLTDHISRIVENLTKFVSSEPYQIEPVSIRPVVHEAAIGTLDRFPALGDYFFLEIADDVPETAFVRADKNRLSQVIGTLLSSAWDACRDTEHPELVISIQQTKDDIVVSVDHNGSYASGGATGSGRTKIDSVASEGGTSSGPGVGFTIAMSFVNGMGGQLEYKSSVLGGSRSEVILPKFKAGTA